MRNDRTDWLGYAIQKQYKQSGLSTKEFVEKLKNTGEVFDTGDDYFHFIDGNEIVSAYFTQSSWYAKY